MEEATEAPVLEKVKFECSGCSLCCSNVGKVVTDARTRLMKGDKSRLNIEIAKFPFKWGKKGECDKLGTDGKCTIYDTRPDICNVETMFEKIGKKMGQTREQYFAFQGKCCNILIKGAGLNDTFKVKEIY